ncbi:hypothetical protein A1O3_01804 [Capronia epimyces CBS 606.96]|uniref:Uncharacterized protein n=1 Tax=Capronia epimyces CBS 606.96 TaxID=1182542 RepID=W9YK15_9EURO|nr:uncharacterized protein A1O3_01804 [Capronia epimyces CBS 606.96]EXJ93247.1 hypothetical protein A1O3_01804 [Capronia epimyces CBS 606.96]
MFSIQSSRPDPPNPGNHRSRVLNTKQPIGNRTDSHEAYCQCAREAAEIWSLIQHLPEVSLDIVMAASDQALEVWGKSQACQACPRSFYETLSKVYAKLVDWFESAVATYTTPSAPSSISGDKVARTDTAESVADDLATTTSERDQRQRLPQSRGIRASPARAVCLPSPMSLGEYEFDEEQSRHLAFDLIGKKLKELAAVLHQMQQMQLESHSDTHDVGHGLNATFARTLRLLSSQNTALANN